MSREEAIAALEESPIWRGLNEREKESAVDYLVQVANEKEK